MGKELRLKSLIRRYRIKYFTESVLASSSTIDPEQASLKRTGWTKASGDVVYGVIRVNHILCHFGAIEECKNV